MPIYEYICEDCGTRFEMLRSMNEADETIPCKSCQSSHTQRALSVFFAQSSSQIIAGGIQRGCAGCSSSSCSTCNTN